MNTEKQKFFRNEDIPSEWVKLSIEDVKRLLSHWNSHSKYPTSALMSRLVNEGRFSDLCSILGPDISLIVGASNVLIGSSLDTISLYRLGSIPPGSLVIIPNNFVWEPDLAFFVIPDNVIPVAHD